MSKRSYSTMNDAMGEPQEIPQPPTKKPPTNSQSPLGSKNMSLDSIPSKTLRTKTLSLLRTVPTITVQKAYHTLISFNDNVEIAAWHILEEQSADPAKGGQQLNEFIDIDTRLRVLRLKEMCPDNSLQECYVAIKVGEGNLDAAVSHLGWMSRKKGENADGGEGGTGFLGKESWLDGVKY